MSKAINWSKGFEAIVLGENTEDLFCAIRPGRLYYDNQYWVDGEVVDIRVDHAVLRQGVVVGELKCCPINALSTDDLARHKPGLQSVDAILANLAERYGKQFTPSDEVTVVYYKNLAMAVSEQ